MRRLLVTIAFVTLGAAACWKTKPNPAYCADGGCDMTADHGDGSEGGDMAHCTTNAECTTASAPVCGADGTCVPCSATAMCTSPSVCVTTASDPKAGQCVECVTNGDCGNKVCTDNACVACTAHSQCDSKICDIDAGTCADPSDILYVDNVACTSGTKNGSPADPFCQVNDAFSSVTSTKKYVSVKGNGTAKPYNPISWNSTGIDAQIIGPGALVGSSGVATFGALSSSAVMVSPSSGTVRFVFDGLDLRGLSAPGVACTTLSAAPTITLRDSNIHESDQEGVNVNKCAAVISRCVITKNHGAITVTGGGTYSVENNFIVGNLAPMTPGPSVSLGGGGDPSVFRYNTVVANSSSGTTYASGVDCGSGGSKTVDASIVYGNMPSGAPTFTASCSKSNIADGTTGTPTFASATDFHLDPAANACCIDVISATTTGQPKVDIDNEARPKGNGFDVGADEAK